MYSVQIAVSDGTLTRISLSIEYFEKDDITLYRNLDTTPMVLGTDWQWDGDTAINLLSNIPVPDGGYIVVRRNTNIDRAFNIYDGGAAFSRDTLDENFRQMIYLAQEFTEGNGLTGLFFPLDMHGFKITNLGDGTDPKDAVNKGQLDVVDQRVTNIEQSFVTDTVSYPWFENTTEIKDVFSPPFTFTRAVTYVDGVCQTPGYSYIVVDNQILLAEPVPAGTHFFARLGEDVGLDPDYATTDQLADVVSTLELDINSKASKGANSDITSLSGLTTPLSTTQGGTGSATGNAPTATILATARTIQTNLASTSSASFDGSTNIVPGVTGILPVNNGGNGASTPANARANLGAAMSGINNDISNLAGLSGGITGLTAGTAAASGIVGEVIESAAASATTLTTAVNANVHSISLPAGEWLVDGSVRYMNAGVLTSRTFGINTTSVTLPPNWYDQYNTTTSLAVGTSVIPAPTRLLRLNTTTTVYMVAQAVFTAGANTAQGYLRARRIR